MKKVKGVILYGLCAVLWSVRAVLDIVCKPYTYDVLFKLDTLCAVCWIVGFIIQAVRYRRAKKSKE